jgi:hypothetical protein
MTHTSLAPSPHLWQIYNCITRSVQPPKLNRRQPEEGLTVAGRKPNVSSDVRPDHFGPNRNPPHGVKPYEAFLRSRPDAKEGNEIQKP